MVQDLTKGTPSVTNFRFGLPLAIGMGSHGLFNLVDLKMVGYLGGDAVAAIHLGSVINFIPMILANGLTIGAAIILSQNIGAGRRDLASKTANRVLLGITLAGIMFGLVGYLAAGPLVQMQNARGESLRLGIQYLEILSLGTVTMFILLHVSAVLRAAGSSFRPVMLLAGSNILNLVLDYYLIFGCEPLGIAPMGVVGAAWGTVFGRGAGAVVGLVLLALPSTPIKLGRARLANAMTEMWRATKLGFPQSMQMFTRVLAVLYLTILAGNIAGDNGIAAISIGTRMDMVLLFFAVGWGSGATTSVGQNLGAGNPQRARHAAVLMTLFASISVTFFAILFAWQGEWIVRFFIPEGTPEMVAAGSTYFSIMAWSYPAAAAAIVLSAGINGAGVTIPPLIIDSIMLTCVFIPMTTLLATCLENIWWTTVGVQIIIIICYETYFRRSGWLQRKV